MTLTHTDNNAIKRLRAGLADFSNALTLQELPVNGRLDQLMGLTLVADGCEASLGCLLYTSDAADE